MKPGGGGFQTSPYRFRGGTNPTASLIAANIGPAMDLALSAPFASIDARLPGSEIMAEYLSLTGRSVST